MASSASTLTEVLHRLTDEVGDAVIVTDAGGVVEHWSSGAVSLFGYSAEEASGQPLEVLLPSAEGPPGGRALPAWVESRHHKGGGVNRTVARVTALGGDETPAGFLILVRAGASTGTDHTRTRDGLARFRSVVDSMSEGVVVQAADGSIEACNLAAERILGLTAEQLSGRTSMDPRWRSIHEDGSDFPGEDHPAMVTLRTGRAIEGAIMGVHTPDGALHWLSINTQPVVQEAGAPPSGVVVTFTDVTELRRQANELTRTLGRLERMMSASHDGYWDNDLRTGEVFISPALRAIFGTEQSTDRINGMLVDAAHPNDVAALLEDMRQTRAGEKDRIDLELRLRWMDGEWRWMNLRGSAVGQDATGRPTHVAGVVIDVDERHRLREALESVLTENVALVAKLEKALGKALSGYLPVCAWCKAVRDESGEWVALDRYVEQHSDALVTHGMCPTCYQREVGELPSGS